KGIDFFGPRILKAWWGWLSTQPLADQVAAVEQVAALPDDEARRLAEEVVNQAAPDASPEDKAVAVDYLSAIPSAPRPSLLPPPPAAPAPRQSLLPGPGGRGLTFPPQLLSGPGQGLANLLPQDVPPFVVPSDLAGTAYRLEKLLGTGGFGAVYKASIRSEQFE